LTSSLSAILVVPIGPASISHTLERITRVVSGIECVLPVFARCDDVAATIAWLPFLHDVLSKGWAADTNQRAQ
jgi:hypothetical protein